MKKNIRIAIYLIILIIVSNLISCTNTSGQQSQPTSKTESVASSQVIYESSQPDISGKDYLWCDRKITIGVLGPGAESAWRTTLTKDIMDAAEEWNIELKYLDGQGKDELQIEHLEKLIEEKVDAIGFMPVMISGWDEILTKVKEAGIPLIFLDRYAECSDESLWTSHIVNDWKKEGQMAGEWLINYLKKNNKLEEQYNFVELTGTIGSTITLGRDKGFSEIINNYDNIKKIYSKNCDFSTTPAYKEMFNILQETTDIDVLFCHNDYMAFGAIQAIEEAGLVPGKDIIIISADGTNDALEEIVDGKIACSVECNPLMGDLFMEACVRLANGEEIEREIHPVDRVFDITNAQEKLDAGYGY